MAFPDSCIRGISNCDCLLEGGAVAYMTLFDFHSSPLRNDGWTEESINWMDDEHALGFTLNQVKESGDPQFKMGVAILPRVELDRIRRRHGFAGHFGYERAPLEGNQYHGNLLLRDDISKPLKNMIRSALALAAQIVPREGGYLGTSDSVQDRNK
jgi:hypothetical protein